MILSGFQARAPGITADLTAGVEKRRQPGLDALGDFLTRAVLGIAVGAGAGETLIAAGDIIGDARERRARHDRFVAGDLDQIVLRINANVFVAWQPGVRRDD